MGRYARTLAVSVLSCLAAASAAAAQTPPEKIAEIAERDARATCRYAAEPAAAQCQPGATEADVAAFEGSWNHDALLFQHRLGDDLGMANAPWAATHNSYNSIAEMGPALSTLDSNQQLGQVEQLRIGIRSLEIDVHRFHTGQNVVCHARGANEGHLGCSVEKSLDATLAPIADWVLAHPDQVLMLYLEDHMGDAAGYDAAAESVRAAFGTRLYEPAPPADPAKCQVLPNTLTREDVRDAGASVFVVSDCGPGTGWRTVAFDWGPMHDEAQPDAFDPETCGPFPRERLSRYYEDSTGLSYAVAGGDPPARMSEQVTAAMVRCGIDHIGFDQLLPRDGRLEALVWSWAPGERATGAGDCVEQDEDGRWHAESCGSEPKRRAACRRSDGSWTLTAKAVAPREATKRCAQLGARWAAPRTGYENTRLRDRAGTVPVLLGLAKRDGRFAPVDAR